MLKTHSEQYKNDKLIQVLKTPWQNTWRSAAVDWFASQPWSGWKVIGKHWLYQGYGIVIMFQTETKNCSIYDGWWGSSDKVTQSQKPKISNEISIDTQITNMNSDIKNSVNLIETMKMNLPEKQKTMLLKDISLQQQDNLIKTSPMLSGNTPPKDILTMRFNALSNNLQSPDLAFDFDFDVFKENSIVRTFPLGTWNNGWTGVGVDFNDDKLGQCTYFFIQAFFIKWEC